MGTRTKSGPRAPWLVGLLAGVVVLGVVSLAFAQARTEAPLVTRTTPRLAPIVRPEAAATFTNRATPGSGLAKVRDTAVRRALEEVNRASR